MSMTVKDLQPDINAAAQLCQGFYQSQNNAADNNAGLDFLQRACDNNIHPTSDEQSSPWLLLKRTQAI